MTKRLALALLLSSGCSLAVMNKPTTSNCTRSKAPAIVDTTVAVVATVTAIAAMVAIDGGNQAREGVAGGALLGGVLFTASAGNGWGWSRQCSERGVK